MIQPIENTCHVHAGLADLKNQDASFRAFAGKRAGLSVFTIDSTVANSGGPGSGVHCPGCSL